MQGRVWGVIALLSLLLGGCRDIYGQFCGATQEKIACLKAVDSPSEKVLHRYLGGYERRECAYRLKVSHYTPNSCSNPTSKALGGDVDGYARLEVFYEGGCYYRAQAGFKSGRWEETLPELTQRLRDEAMLP